MLEAGHMAQNLLLVSTAIGTFKTPRCGLRWYSYIAELLDLDAEAEQLVHGVLLSPPRISSTNVHTAMSLTEELKRVDSRARVCPLKVNMYGLYMPPQGIRAVRHGSLTFVL